MRTRTVKPEGGTTCKRVMEPAGQPVEKPVLLEVTDLAEVWKTSAGKAGVKSCHAVIGRIWVHPVRRQVLVSDGACMAVLPFPAGEYHCAGGCITPELWGKAKQADRKIMLELTKGTLNGYSLEPWADGGDRFGRVIDSALADLSDTRLSLSPGTFHALGKALGVGDYYQGLQMRLPNSMSSDAGPPSPVVVETRGNGFGIIMPTIPFDSNLPPANPGNEKGASLAPVRRKVSKLG